MCVDLANDLVQRLLSQLPSREPGPGALTTHVSYLEIYNADPKPFVWHKTADEILASIAHYCQRISDSGH